MKAIYVFFFAGILQLQSTAQSIMAIDSFMKYCQSQLRFDGVVLLADRNKIVYERAFGKANRGTNLNNTPATKFRFGSISKQFTAWIVLQFVENKKLSLNDPVATFIRGFDQPSTHDIRILNLLTHTSGLVDYTSLKGFNNRLLYKQDSIIHMIESAPLLFTPSSSYSYSNSNYYLLAVIIEKITGKKFGDVLDKMLLEKAAMFDSGEEDGRLIKGEATGYLYRDGEAHPAPFIEMKNTTGGGGMYGTASDLLRWSLFFQRFLQGDSVLKDAIRPYSLVDGSKTIYSCGWALMPNVIFHTGHINGFAGLIAIDTLHHQTIILLSNDDYRQLYITMESLRKMLQNDPLADSWTKSRGLNELSDYRGIYRKGDITVTIKDTLDCIEGTVLGQKQFLRPFDKDEFYFLDLEGIVKFERGPLGDVVALDSFQNYSWITFQKVE